MIGGVNQRNQAARVHRVADDGGDMNHRQNRLLKVPRLACRQHTSRMSVFHPKRTQGSQSIWCFAT